MTELDLYKFLNDEDNGVQQYNWAREEFLVWISLWYLEDFTDMIYNYLDDSRLTCNLQKDCVCVDIVGICEYYDIDLENILEKEND